MTTLKQKTSTTELHHLKLSLFEHYFTWGEVVKIHSIGNYDIVEYHPWVMNGIVPDATIADESKSDYSCYLDGRHLGISCTSLDEAILTCMTKGRGNAAAFILAGIEKISA